MPEYTIVQPERAQSNSTEELFTASAINRAAVKKLALAAAQRFERPFTRVSGDFLDRADAALKQFIDREVNSQPGVGVTIK
jgi:hypothetical protein